MKHATWTLTILGLALAGPVPAQRMYEKGTKRPLFVAAAVPAAPVRQSGAAGTAAATKKNSSRMPSQTLRLPVTRDNWFSAVGKEGDGNNGGAARLKLKSIQEMSLIDIDTAPLAGRIVRSATLHLRSAGEPRLKRVSVSSFAAEWVEGTASGYEPQEGSSTFRHRRHPDQPWTIPGSDLCSVILGQGGTVWRSVDATAPDEKGWQTIAVDPLLIALRVAGVSQGFFLFDDTGSEWTRDGERFEPQMFPNRFVFSRDSNQASAPFLEVTLGSEDHQPPEAPGAIEAAEIDLPAGEAMVSWITPRDEGPAGTVGFLVQVDGRDVPRYLIPPARSAGERVSMHVRDLDLKPGATAALSVRAVDGAGNVSPASTAQVTVSRHRPLTDLPGKAIPPFAGSAPLPKLGTAEVAILDELDKVQPGTGRLIPPQPDGYLAANPLWSAREKKIRLYAARNEFVAFQVHVRGGVGAVRPALTFSDAPMTASFGRYESVPSAAGPLPDPIVPLDAQPRRDDCESLLVELLIPPEARPGPHHGTLTLTSGAHTLSLQVELTVWDFTLPDALSFLPDMNCYGLPANERDYYRLAHRHRTVLNCVPYSQNGVVHEGGAPKWDGHTLDWNDWDRRFGPLFDGSAFADLPRKGVPIECFYLPIHENWPTPIEGNYNGDYWADRAFPAHYRQDLVAVSRQFAAHLHAKGWNETFFQFFLNGKNDFKRQGWSRGSSPWLLDEPANWQDYWALRWFGLAFHEGIRQAGPAAPTGLPLRYLAPEWQREALDGLLDYYVVGGAFRPYRRMVLDRKAALGQVVLEYGGTNPIEAANVQPVGWSLDVWALGADGVLPWQTIGTADSWNHADVLALFYPGRAGQPPVPSIRLKAYRRGQQDVEYLTLLARALNQPRWALGPAVRRRCIWPASAVPRAIPVRMPVAWTILVCDPRISGRFARASARSSRNLIPHRVEDLSSSVPYRMIDRCPWVPGKRLSQPIAERCGRMVDDGWRMPDD